MNLDKDIELNYDKIETQEGIFYIPKKRTYERIITGYLPSQNALSDEKQNLRKIVQEKVKVYIEQYTSKDYPEDKRINTEYYVGNVNVYFQNGKENYNDGDDIVALVNINATPINGNSSFWKENFPDYEFYYNEETKEYILNTYIFVRLSVNSQTKDYDISYVGNKPENYDKYIAELKETKGIDLENLDIERILNTSYKDDMQIVASNSTSATNANKSEYNSANIEEISNFATVIRIVCVLALIIIITISVIKKKRN